MQRVDILFKLWRMGTEILEVRDVPSRDVQILRARAAARNISLSSYLRELIHDDVCRPEPGAVLQRIASRDSVEADAEDIRGLVRDDQR